MADQRVVTDVDQHVFDVLNLEAAMHGISRSRLIREIVTEWVCNGGYRPDTHPAPEEFPSPASRLIRRRRSTTRAVECRPATVPGTP